MHHTMHVGLLDTPVHNVSVTIKLLKYIENIVVFFYQIYNLLQK